MGKVKRNARKTLEVKIMFEPSRLAADHLADAYNQLVPLRSGKSHSVKSSSKPAKSNANTATRRR
jgi:hypothetical protein